MARPMAPMMGSAPMAEPAEELPVRSFVHLPKAPTGLGKGITEKESISALSVEELQTLDEGDIMEKFMAENFAYSPTPEQSRLFREVLAWSREEGELG